MILSNKLIVKPRSSLILLAGLFCTLHSLAQSTNLTGIAHVALRVNDVEKSREFYKTLGFDQAFEFTDAGKTSTAFIKVNDRQFIELVPRTSDSQPGGLLHICFEAADIEAVHKAYVDRGLQPTEVKKARAGNLLFVMHGPDGQLLEYTQYMPDSLHSQDRGKHLGEHRISEHILEASTDVKDIGMERVFYITKLAFKDARTSGTELFVAGNSGDMVELQSEPPATKPRVVFAVSNVRHAANDLRTRGLTVQKSDHAVFVTDPDGAVIAFASPAKAGD